MERNPYYKVYATVQNTTNALAETAANSDSGDRQLI